MTTIICPGIHSPELTDRFIQSLKLQNYLILPTEHPPYSAIAIMRWLSQQQLAKAQPLSFIAFSAGVVGAIGAANLWQMQGGKIDRFVAFDGWGMPLVGNFALVRISHDRFTHYSSALLGAGSGFYADPAVGHLDLWRSPSSCCGWRVISPGCKTRDTLGNYLADVFNS